MYQVDNIQIADRIIEARKNKSAKIGRLCTQRDIAEACDMYKETVSHYERGRTMPTLVNAAKLANYLEVSIEWLCFGANK